MNSVATDASSVISGVAFDALPESIRSYIRYLENVVQKQQIQIQELHDRVHELETRLAKDSSNSSKPLSSESQKVYERSPEKKLELNRDALEKG